MPVALTLTLFFPPRSDGELESRGSSGYSSAEASAGLAPGLGGLAGRLWGICHLGGGFPSPVSPPQVNQELSRQLLRDGYHLDEVPDDEDLDLIPPKPAAAPCPWCFGDSLCCVLQ